MTSELRRATTADADRFAKTFNIAFYERLGFSVVAEETTPGGGPIICFMRT